jgi:hypothetical protein
MYWKNMAKKKVTRKPKARKKPAKKVKPKPVDVMSLECPNHISAVSLVEDVSDVEERGCFPLAGLMVPTAHGVGTPGGLAFVDPIYGCRTSGDREIYAPPYAPPTWMDPEVFVRLIKDLPEIKKIAAEAIKRKSKAPIKKMIPVLQDLFEEYYLGYLLDRFDEVKPLLADWIVAYHADQAEQEKLTKKKTTRRKAKSNVNDSES